MEKTALVIGGSSGLGLEIAKKLSSESNVIVTGRHDPQVESLEYREFELAQGAALSAKVGEFVMALPEVSTLVFAAGFFQEGRVTDLSDQDIESMIDVGGRSLMYIMREILKKQGSLDELVTITSTSQWTPRQLEPIYNFVKAGAAHLSNSFAEDGRVGKVLVAGPAGMATPFWTQEQIKEREGLLDPKWVAEEVIELREGDYKYRYAQILRQPPRVVTIEERQ